MSDRRRYEGEEELQLQLLEVTEDPTFGKQAPQYKGPLPISDRMDVEDAVVEAETRAAKKLH